VRFASLVQNGQDSNSVYSEPLAIYFSLCHFLKDGEKVKIEFAEEFKNELKMKIRVATDNVSAQQTMNRGFASRSFDINEAIKKLREAFPLSDFEFEFCFVPGWCNPADPFSRGKFGNNVNAKDGHKDVDINKLRRDMGDVRVSTVKAGSTCHAVSTG
jgi:RNA recognition motif-containing protein